MQFAVVRGTLDSRNAYRHSVQNLLFPLIVSKNIKIKVHETIILPVVSYGCETSFSHGRKNKDRGCLKTGC
jgi:hypothetical protein